MNFTVSQLEHLMGYGDGLKKDRHGTYCWRWVVPSDLKSKFPTREIQCSLGIKEVIPARLASLSLRIAVADLATYARAGFAVSESRLKSVLDLAREAAKRHTQQEQAQAEFFEAHEAPVQAVQQLQSMQTNYTAALTGAVRQTTLATVEATARKLGPPLSQVVEKFVKENETRGSWTPKTKDKYMAVYNWMVEGLGNPHVNTVTRHQTVDCPSASRRS